jgi:hypothetical protein
MASKKQKQENIARANEEVSLPLDLVYRAISSVSIASSSDDTRPHLCGVHVRYEGDVVNFAATNGHWLAVFCVRVDDENGEPMNWKRGEFHLTNDAVKRLIKEMKWIRQKWKSLIDGQQITFKPGRKKYVHMIGVLEMELVTHDDFPELKKVLPAKMPKKRSGGVFTIAPQYLRKCAMAIEAACDGSFKPDSVRFEVCGDTVLDPLIITSPLVPELTILTMPVRIDEGLTKTTASARPALLIT